MLQKLCPMCETSPGRWNQPAPAEHPEAAVAECAALERRLQELDRGLVTPERLYACKLAMCAMCQEIVRDVEQGRPNPQVGERIRFRIARLRDVAGRAC